MNAQKRVIKRIQNNIKKKQIFDDKFSSLISDLYQKKLLKVEREKKVLLERFNLSTEGKGVVLENKQ